MHNKTRAYLQSIGAQERALPDTPKELVPNACYVPDAGYCIVVIPERFASAAKPGRLEDYEIPIPTRYVLERGYRIEGDHVYCDVAYDDTLGAAVPDEYYTFEVASTSSSKAGFVKMEVGQPFAPMIGQGEGARFDIDASGAIVCVNMHRPTQKEIDAFAVNKPLRVGLFLRKGVMFMLFKFGDLAWMDAPYNPHLSGVTPLQYLPEGHGMALTCILTDAPSGIVMQNIRLVGLSTMFTRQFSMAMRDVLAQPFDPVAYQKTVLDLMRQYSIKDMVAGAIATCSV